MQQYYGEISGSRHVIFPANKPIDAYKKLAEEYGENNIIQFRPASKLDVIHVEAIGKDVEGENNKEVVMKTKSGKEIIGYGKSPKGKLIHAIVKGDDETKLHGTALCDSRTKDIEILEKEFKSEYVTCKACLSLIIPLKEVIDGKKANTKAPATKAPATKAPPKKTPKYLPPKVDEVLISPKKGETPKQNHWKVMSTDKPTLKNILHVPTDQIMFEKIPTKVARRAVFDMNSRLDVKWNNINNPIPKGFISKIRLAVADAYEALGQAPKKAPRGPARAKNNKGGGKAPKSPKKPPRERKITRRGQTPEEQKKTPPEGHQPPRGRKITRRSKPIKKGRKITRRNKQTGLLKGRREGSPAYVIGSLIIGEGGTTIRAIIDTLKVDYNLSDKKALSKIKGFIRKATRRHGYQITITQGKDPNKDHLSYGD